MKRNGILSILLHIVISCILIFGSAYALGPGIKDTFIPNYFGLLVFLSSILSLLIAFIRLLVYWAYFKPEDRDDETEGEILD